VSGVPTGVYHRGISETGRQYASYHHHSQRQSDSVYAVTPGTYAESLVLHLPGGTYKADWVDPASGSLLGTEEFTHKGGNRTFRTPSHSVDIALRIVARSETSQGLFLSRPGAGSASRRRRLQKTDVRNIQSIQGFRSLLWRAED
jgi:hypothetical protein